MPARLARLINELIDQNAPPSLTTVLRVAKACQDEIIDLHHLIGKSDLLARPIRPIDEVIREECERAIAVHGGCHAKAARALGVPESTLYRWRKRWTK